MNNLFGTPVEIGQMVPLTKNYDDQEGFISDGNGGKVCHVKGQIVHVADLDRPASRHFGREVLRWRLHVASRIMNSQIKDVAVQPVEEWTIGGLRKRFPDAFNEYERKYGNAGLPERKDPVVMGFAHDQMEDYDGPDTLDEYHASVRGQVALSAAGKEDRRKELERQLAALDSETPEKAFEQPSDFVQPTDGTPISGWGAIPVSARSVLMQHGVMTVEDFAKANDSLFGGLGVGQWNKWRKKAQEEAGA
jgi:hypothetical protein